MDGGLVVVVSVEGWGDGLLLLYWGVGVGVSVVLQSEVFINVAGYVMAGVKPAVFPKDLCHFVHGLLACVAIQVFLTAV